jgi:hypothetical protein
MKRLTAIEQRNARVEADKAWETSITRRVVIALLTYAVIVAFLLSINASNAWLHALVPVAGYLLSTAVLSPLKQWWLQHVYVQKRKTR